MVSQVLNFSNNKTYKFLKEKYKIVSDINRGIFGIEIRDIPDEYFKNIREIRSENIYQNGNNFLFTDSFYEIKERILLQKRDDDLNNNILDTIYNFEQYDSFKYTIGRRDFFFNRAYIMGVLNITPDSFSDGGKFEDVEKAVNYALEMLDSGADIIDVGGESTRPGSESVSELEELRRVMPVIEKLINLKPDAVISVDTTKAKVAEEALRTGALIVNDISGGTFDPEIFKVASDYNSAMIIMHMKGTPKSMQISPNYSEVVLEVYDFLYNQSEIAVNNGIRNIFIDPGIGFGKSLDHNLCLIDRLDDFKSLGFPIAIGLSRKSFIGNILNLPVEERDDATNAMNSLALSKGARLIRTHNVKQAVQTCKLFNKINAN